MKNFISLFTKVRYPFARAQPIRAPEPVTLKDYYEKLLNQCQMNSNGRMKIPESQVAGFINLVNEEEMQTAIEGFSNMLGHNTVVSCRLFDRFIAKCIKYNQIDYVLQVMRYHVALRYFPSDDIINQLIEKLEESDLVQFSKIVQTRQFLKVSKEQLEKMVCDNAQISYAVYRTAVDRNIQLSGKSLYIIARNFLSGQKIRKVEVMKEFAENTQTNDSYSLLALLFTYFYMGNIEQTIVTIAKIDGSVLKEEQKYLEPLFQRLEEKVKDDEKWNQRFQELKAKVL